MIKNNAIPLNSNELSKSLFFDAFPAIKIAKPDIRPRPYITNEFLCNCFKRRLLGQFVMSLNNIIFLNITIEFTGKKAAKWFYCPVQRLVRHHLL